jgi:hypothetical protein
MDARQRSSFFDEIGGEPLEGSGFEDEEAAVDEQFESDTDPEDEQ